MSSFYSIDKLTVIEPAGITIRLGKVGFASTVEIRAVGIKASGSGFTDWIKCSITTPFPWDGFVTFNITAFYFYFTGEEYTICVEILDQADGTVSCPSKNIILPLLVNIYSSYQIGQVPTQQSQNVYYDNKYVGNTSSCLANAIASVKEVQSIRKAKPVQGSVGWFWGKTGTDETGTEYNVAFQALARGGIPPHQVVNKTNGVYEYPDIYFLEDARAIYKSTGDVPAYAEPQKIEKFDEEKDVIDPFANTLAVICDAIKNPKLCVILIIITDNSIFSKQAENNGIVPSLSGFANGGHAMIVLGWQTIDNKKYWVCKNSWCRRDKTPMGQDGYYFIPFNWGGYNSSAPGIARFCVLKDDDNAPKLPELPIELYPSMVGYRHADGVTFTCTTTDKAGVTRYRLRWVQKDTTKEIYTYSSDLQRPTFKFYTYIEEDVDPYYLYKQGVRWGYTYIVDASAEIDGIWSKSSTSVQITLLPFYGIVDYVTPLSASSLGVKICQQEEDVGNFSFIRVFRGKKNTMQKWPFRYEDYIDVNSYDDLAVFDGLTTGDTWAFVSRTCLEADNGKGGTEELWALFVSEQEVVATVGAVEPFKWTHAKNKNENFNLTADEWNAFTARVNATRVSKGLINYNFETASRNGIFKADHYNSARQAIQAIQGYGTYIPTVKKGDNITADMMNILVTELNNIK